MKSAVRFVSTLFSASVFLVACGSADPGTGGGTGGQTATTGGATGTGSGGSGTGSGGAPGSGGASNGTGGAVTSSGGVTGSGGAGTGGASATGGRSGSGGATGSGGMTGSGGRGSAGSTGSGGRGSAGSTGSGGRGSAGSTGTGGGSAGGGTAGGSGTFAPVAMILGTSCGTGQCHQAGPHIDLRNNAGLYGRIVNGMPNGTMTEAACKTRTLVVPGNPAMSVISQVIKAAVAGCTGARMPDNCSTTGTNPRACLTTAQIATIDNWITAGAPM